MIELPEAVTIAKQIESELQGKTIVSGSRGNSPHKFAFYSYSPEEYAAILPGKTVGESRANGSIILTRIEPGYLLALGDGGERILYHKTSKTLPVKYQLMLQFTDESFLSVNVQGWGSCQLWTQEECQRDPYAGKQANSPLDESFTLDYFLSLFDSLKPGDKLPLKQFIISKPGVHGIGNGYLQDILFLAKIHPRRKALDTSLEERRALYAAIQKTIRAAVASGGRDSEKDLYNCPGSYLRILHSEMVGKPCPSCGEEAIEKISFMGGSSYYCPSCQK